MTSSAAPFPARMRRRIPLPATDGRPSASVAKALSDGQRGDERRDLLETQDRVDVVVVDGVPRHRGSLGFRRVLGDGEPPGCLDGKEATDPVTAPTREQDAYGPPSPVGGRRHEKGVDGGAREVDLRSPVEPPSVVLNGHVLIAGRDVYLSHLDRIAVRRLGDGQRADPPEQPVELALEGRTAVQHDSQRRRERGGQPLQYLRQRLDSARGGAKEKRVSHGTIPIDMDHGSLSRSPRRSTKGRSVSIMARRRPACSRASSDRAWLASGPKGSVTPCWFRSSSRAAISSNANTSFHSTVSTAASLASTSSARP